jgi:hypothetical protein
MDLKKTQMLYPLTSIQELKLLIIHNYITRFISNEEEREEELYKSFFYVLEEDENELDPYKEYIK